VRTCAVARPAWHVLNGKRRFGSLSQ
jgi:hypothetical protein